MQDRRTDDRSREQVPAIDAQQDWNLTAGSQDNGFTILEFFRLLDTTDTAGDLVIEEVKSTHAPQHLCSAIACQTLIIVVSITVHYLRYL